jgi:hypothetical protein
LGSAYHLPCPEWSKQTANEGSGGEQANLEATGVQVGAGNAHHKGENRPHVNTTKQTCQCVPSVRRNDLRRENTPDNLLGVYLFNQP